MVFRCAVLASLVIMLSVMTCFGEDLRVTVQSFPSGLTLQPGVAAFLTVEGLKKGEVAEWYRVYVAEDEVKKWGNSYFLGGTKAGPRTIAVKVTLPGSDRFVLHQFDYGEKKDDEDDDENPIPLGQKVVVIIEESEPPFRTTVIGNLLTKLRLDPWMKKQGHTLTILDRDQQLVGPDGQTSPHPHIKAHYALGDSLPVIAMYHDNKLVHRGPLPVTYEEVRKLIEGE